MAAPRKVVLLACGSFNPVTNMHLRMFELARDALHRTGQYKVVGGIISPVNDAYGKKDLVPAKDRTAMIRLALSGSDWIRVDTWESELDKWSETAKVLKHFHSMLNSTNQTSQGNSPRRKRLRKADHNTTNTDEVDLSLPPDKNLNWAGPVDMKLLCGADLLESFGVPDLWKDEHIEEIVGKYGVVCINRAGSNPEQFIYNSDVLYRNQNNILLVTEWITNDISATKIRRALRRGESVKYLVQDSVIDYIKAHSLYGTLGMLGDKKSAL